jgi:hypothetical protein
MFRHASDVLSGLSVQSNHINVTKIHNCIYLQYIILKYYILNYIFRRSRKIAKSDY